jgi:hypothetical protein
MARDPGDDTTAKSSVTALAKGLDQIHGIFRPTCAKKVRELYAFVNPES